MENNGWIKWFGSSFGPKLPQQYYDVKYRSGIETHDNHVSAVRWEWTGNKSDIVAYRIAKRGDLKCMTRRD